MNTNQSDDRMNIFVTVDIFENIVSKKWLFLANNQQIKEVWKFKVEVDKSEAGLSQMRDQMRKMQRQISKESLKNFEHLSEGMGNDFKVSYEIL